MTGEALTLLCFGVGDRIFAVDIMGIREILRHYHITPVPDAPAHVAGVLNLRGSLLPVIDPQEVLLGPSARAAAPDAKLIVLRTGGRSAGVLVDQVLDVVRVPLQDLTPLPGRDPGCRGLNVAAFRRETEDGGTAVVLLIRIGALLEGQPADPGGPP